MPADRLIAAALAHFASPASSSAQERSVAATTPAQRARSAATAACAHINDLSSMTGLQFGIAHG